MRKIKKTDSCRNFERNLCKMSRFFYAKTRLEIIENECFNKNMCEIKRDF